MPADQPPGRGLFAVGGPTFGQGAAKIAGITPALRSGCDGFGDIHFEDLPGSRREVIEILKLWPAQGPGDRQPCGAAATETAVKQKFGAAALSTSRPTASSSARTARRARPERDRRRADEEGLP